MALDTWSFLEGGAAPTDRRTAERRIMQVNSSVENRYYAPHQTKKSVKYGAGFTQMEVGKIPPNETTGNPGTAKFTDYQEFYKAWMSQSRTNPFQYALQNDAAAETGIDFSYFAPNAPDKVKQAFMEAANETGYHEYSGNEKMDHISQILVRQVENRMNGMRNPQDVLGSTAASALQAARQMLSDLENPLMPVSQRGENAGKYIEQEKEFYRAFIEKLEDLAGADAEDAEESVDYAKFLRERMNEILTKIKNGDTETSYQIGAQSFTEKEWEELLDKFDSVEEAVQELMKEEQEKKEAEEMQKGWTDGRL